jgi:hypothetical protein
MSSKLLIPVAAEFEVAPVNAQVNFVTEQLSRRNRICCNYTSGKYQRPTFGVVCWTRGKGWIDVNKLQLQYMSNWRVSSCI